MMLWYTYHQVWSDETQIIHSYNINTLITQFYINYRNLQPFDLSVEVKMDFWRKCEKKS